MLLTVVANGIATFYDVEGEQVDQVAALKVGEGLRPERLAVLALNVVDLLAHVGVKSNGQRPARAAALPAAAEASTFTDTSETTVLEAVRAYPGLTAGKLGVIMFGTDSRRQAVQSSLTRLKQKSLIQSGPNGGYVVANGKRRPRGSGRKTGAEVRYPTSPQVLAELAKHPDGRTPEQLAATLDADVKMVSTRLSYLVTSAQTAYRRGDIHIAHELAEPEPEPEPEPVVEAAPATVTSANVLALIEAAGPDGMTQAEIRAALPTATAEQVKQRLNHLAGIHKIHNNHDDGRWKLGRAG